ncbi:ABC transporter ATP-binding protein [Kineococcus sp. SYSU DK005]|uniref:ABC transporter ATP-binding protein n=1 Tax=Kineococcus sp. SYSU DK005 TaxID=3383126 RepID=UPI003D7C75C2
MSEVLLRVEDLHVEFPSEAGTVHAVRGLSYEVRAGEVLGIVGESGSGKSVSSMAVMGLLPPRAKVRGSITFRGEELLGASERTLARVRGGSIAMVFQDPLSALTPVYQVGEQIAETLRVHRSMSRAAAAERAVQLLDTVGIPDAARRARAYPHEFSGGMRQRAMIAMAIANDPDVLIADEPTTALDVTIQAQVLEVLDTARQITGAAVVMISHDLGVVAGMADRVAVMYAGRAVETGAVRDVYHRPRMPYTLGLLGAVPRPDDREGEPLVPIAGTPPQLHALPAGCPFRARCPVSVPVCAEVEPPLAETGTGGRAACHRAHEIRDGAIGGVPVFARPPAPEPVLREPRERREVVLEVQDLVREYPLTKGALFRRRYGTVHAVDGVSFDVRAGECLGVVGESGCGKTSMITQILELVAPQSGTVRLGGRDVGQLSARDRRALRRDVQIVFQDPMGSLDARMPVGDVIAEPLLAAGASAAERRARVAELLELVGLQPDHADRYPADFSGGQRQRIGIARALAVRPKLLVLDEPVSALDVSIQAGVLNLLQKLQAELGLSYLFVAHDLSVVRHLAHRVAVMYLGRIVEVGDVRDVFERPSHPYTQALLSAVPVPDPDVEADRRRIVLRGDLPSPANPPAGCHFHTRCQRFDSLDEARRAACLTISPQLRPVRATTAETAPEAACHYAG